MKYNLKISSIEVQVERPYSIRGPAASFKADNLEMSADLDQLISGFKELLMKLEPDLSEFDSKPMSFEDEQREANEALQRMAKSAP